MSYATQLGFAARFLNLRNGHLPNAPTPGVSAYPETQHYNLNDHAMLHTHWRTFILNHYTMSESVQNLLSNMVAANGFNNPIYQRTARAFCRLMFSLGKQGNPMAQNPQGLMFAARITLYADPEVRQEVSALRGLVQSNQVVAQFFAEYDQIINSPDARQVGELLIALEKAGNAAQGQSVMSTFGGGMPQTGGMGNSGFASSAPTAPVGGSTFSSGLDQLGTPNPAPGSGFGGDSMTSMFGSQPAPAAPAAAPAASEQPVASVAMTAPAQTERPFSMDDVGGWRTGDHDMEPDTYGMEPLTSRNWLIRGTNFELSSAEAARVSVCTYNEAKTMIADEMAACVDERVAFRDNRDMRYGSADYDEYVATVVTDESNLAKKSILLMLGMFKSDRDVCALTDTTWGYSSLLDLVSENIGDKWHQDIENDAMRIVEICNRQYLLLDSTDMAVTRMVSRFRQFDGFFDRRSRRGHYYMVMPVYDTEAEMQVLTLVNFYNKDEVMDVKMYESAIARPADNAQAEEELNNSVVETTAEVSVKAHIVMKDNHLCGGLDLRRAAEMSAQRVSMLNPGFRADTHTVVCKVSSPTILLLRNNEEVELMEKLEEALGATDPGKAIYELLSEADGNRKVSALVQNLNAKLTQAYTRHIRGSIGLDGFRFNNSYLSEYDEIVEYFGSGEVDEAERLLFADEERALLMRIFTPMNNDEKWERRNELATLTGYTIKGVAGARKLIIDDSKQLDFNTRCWVQESVRTVYKIPMDTYELGIDSALVYAYAAALPQEVQVALNAGFSDPFFNPVILTHDGTLLDVFGPTYMGNHDHSLYRPKLTTHFG